MDGHFSNHQVAALQNLEPPAKEKASRCFARLDINPGEAGFKGDSLKSFIECRG